jgi:RHS repeat-associated protein
VLQDILGFCTAAYGYDDGSYLRFVPAADGNTLTAMLPNHGYWIYVTDPVELLVEGPLSETPVEILEGRLALIGVPGLAQRDRSVLELQIPAFDVLWTHPGDGSGWLSLLQSQPGFMNTLSHTSPGHAYWIGVNANTGIEVPSSEPVDILYYHGDHLHSTNITTDDAGTRSSETLYYPFGSPRHEHDASPDPVDPVYRFGDKENDRESGLQYFEGRYYLSQVGRFTKADPLRSAGPKLQAPQTCNLYAYALNRPHVLIDPTGLDEVNASDVVLRNSAPSELDVVLSVAGAAPGVGGLVATGGSIVTSSVDTAGDVVQVAASSAQLGLSTYGYIAASAVAADAGLLLGVGLATYSVTSYILDKVDAGTTRTEPVREHTVLGMRVPTEAERIRADRQIKKDQGTMQMLYGGQPSFEECPACYDPEAFHGTDPETGQPLPPLQRPPQLRRTPEEPSGNYIRLLNETRTSEELGLEGIGD